MFDTDDSSEMFLVTYVKDKFCSKLYNQVNVFSTVRKNQCGTEVGK